ncbi:MAG: hypothetical protein HONBIEJF_00826 [Fimbriimonadaceae bacterium]|nr:hypothetical protein [Fimbriimonadaceae bacterium]
MRLLKICMAFATIAMGLVANAQERGSITLLGAMTVQEGGTGTLAGRVTNQPRGSFGVTFSEGELVSFQATRIFEVIIPGSTSFFSGEGVAMMRRNGQVVPVRGQFFVMVDDLDLEGLPHPDQFMMEFLSDDRQRIIRHGRVVRGDIAIRLR